MFQVGNKAQCPVPIGNNMTAFPTAGKLSKLHDWLFNSDGNAVESTSALVAIAILVSFLSM